ncbi:glycoside hydrolase family 127 protein [Sphingobacterium thalpophilum]|uniref:Uncharacterized protein conserved in bacteria n=1 Tax=Sphingobacterium thalpophilum TaxID=259 RepID=A0A4U9UG73_9SPHI|nr:beta-L-arabinofuranosidase domain-containing protein [Sphingobacterium thalpophilum]VTR28484.1 Uncharacterized protein conserved in bacteria [Sphingobacterium thalpophilum]
MHINFNIRPYFHLFFWLLLSYSGAVAQERLYKHNFPLQDVKLLEGPFKHAQDLNVNTLLQYDADRLLAPFLKEAGIPAKTNSFPNWIDLDGHVGGHYLSALAIHYAATGDLQLKERMEYMLNELNRCQEKHGNGYVGGVPDGKRIWNEVKHGNVDIVGRYWVPWYNLHKTYAGLRDAWLYAGNEQAKNMFLKLCNWGAQLISNLDDRQMEAMLSNEFGGINEVYADAFQMTSDPRYLEVAKRFSHRELFDSMRVRKDNLDNKHANTQVPKAVGYQRVAEVSGDADYNTAAHFFWEAVVGYRTLANGGNSRREHFPSQRDFLSYMEEREGPESCNTNNMLKLTEGLFRMKPEAKLMDYYERALYNHILSTQHPEHGGYVYFTSARPAHYRVYSKVNSAMWCCVGTGMENHGKYGEMIYSHQGDSLFINLFIPSELNWKEKKLKITQQTNFPTSGDGELSIKTDKSLRLKILVRYPLWLKKGEFNLTISGRNYAKDAGPGEYVVIDRLWQNGDVINMHSKLRFHFEQLPFNPDYIALFRGPILMGAKVGTDHLDGLVAGDHRWGHIASGPLVSLFDTPILIGEREQLISRLNQAQAVDGDSLHYKLPSSLIHGNVHNLLLQPFYQIHDSRYMMYWLSMTEAKFNTLQKEMATKEQEKVALDQRTADMITLGEQQPEIDHLLKGENLSKGVHQGESWRQTPEGGTLSFEFRTVNKQPLELIVRYWGYESGNKKFDILVDGQVLASEDIVKRWEQSKFFDVVYPIPAAWTKNKESINITFRAKPHNSTGRIFQVRLAQKSPNK